MGSGGPGGVRPCCWWSRGCSGCCRCCGWCCCSPRLAPCWKPAAVWRWDLAHTARHGGTPRGNQTQGQQRWPWLGPLAPSGPHAQTLTDHSPASPWDGDEHGAPGAGGRADGRGAPRQVQGTLRNCRHLKQSYSPTALPGLYRWRAMVSGSPADLAQKGKAGIPVRDTHVPPPHPTTGVPRGGGYSRVCE